MFRIFDHWGNFERFEMGYRPAEPTQSKPLLQMVFEERMLLAETALRMSEAAIFDEVSLGTYSHAGLPPFADDLLVSGHSALDLASLGTSLRSQNGASLPRTRLPRLTAKMTRR